MQQITDAKRIEALQRYAAADRSDPFALQRAMTHMRGRICSFTAMRSFDHGGKVSYHEDEAFYDAIEQSEMRRLPTGETYPVVVYRNRVRP